MNKRKSIQDLKIEQIKEYRNYMSAINSSEQKRTKEEKYNFMTYKVLNLLEEDWEFYKTKNWIFYYFDKSIKEIYKIHEDKFKYLLNQCFNINWSTDKYKFLIEELESHMSEVASEVQIYNFSHYDIKTNTLYVHNNWIKIIKITSDKVEEVDNWYNWLIFESNSLFEEWELQKLDETTSWNHIKTLVETINFDTDSKIKKEDYVWLLENYIYCLFFPNILNTRPILAFLWNKWSWKSFFLKLLLYIFYWKETSLTNLPSSDDEFKNSLMNNYLYFIDNLDDSISKTKVDVLCSVATWIWIKKRLLYTTATEMNVKINSFIAITSRTPKFKRVDLNERLLIFKLESLKAYTSETELFSNINRDKTMTNIVYTLHRFIKNINEYKYFQTNFRLADFSNLIQNLDIDNLWEETISKKLELFTREQEEFTMETEPLVDLLEKVIQAKYKPDWIYTAKQLHLVLQQVSNDSFNDWTRIPYNLKTPISLWKKLSELKKWLKNKFIFEITKWNSNITNYVFKWIKNNS